ncbi:MAG: ribosome recycling factor [SAR202 cluster bacterium]|nr:ribosome recycling factor [SAR202 cluster bacterium]
MPGTDEGAAQQTPAAVLSDSERKMGRAIEAFKRDLGTLRTGRASPALIENITVDYYNTPTPLKQLGSISSPDARAIIVQPWDKGAIREIERSLQKSEMGFNPANDGNVITVPIPPLTNERRQELVRLLKRKIEEGKVSIRNVRRDGMDSLKKLEKDKGVSQDASRRAQDQLQKTTDTYIRNLEQAGAAKEAEIMQV